jgi:hypothetical protein
VRGSTVLVALALQLLTTHAGFVCLCEVAAPRPSWAAAPGTTAQASATAPAPNLSLAVLIAPATCVQVEEAQRWPGSVAPTGAAAPATPARAVLTSAWAVLTVLIVALCPAVIALAMVEARQQLEEARTPQCLWRLWPLPAATAPAGPAVPRAGSRRLRPLAAVRAELGARWRRTAALCVYSSLRSHSVYSHMAWSTAGIAGPGQRGGAPADAAARQGATAAGLRPVTGRLRPPQSA